MRLQYIYIEDTFGMKVSFSEKDINFNGAEQYFKVGGQFKRKINNSFFENLYSENISLTAIVGENGTGKTTLLKFIIWLMDTLNGKSTPSVFSQWVWHAIIADNSCYYMVHTEVTFYDDGPSVEEIVFNKITFSEEGLKFENIDRNSIEFNTGLIYYSPHINFNSEGINASHICIDVSTDGLLNELNESNHGDSQTVQFRKRDIKKQIEFIEFAKKKKNTFDFFSNYIRDELTLFFNQSSRFNVDNRFELTGVDHDFYEYMNNCYDNIVPTLTYNIGRMKSGRDEDLIAIWAYRRIIELIFLNYFQEATKQQTDIQPMKSLGQAGLMDTTKLVKNEVELIDLMKNFLSINFSFKIIEICEQFLKMITTKPKFSKSFDSLSISYSIVDSIFHFERVLKDELKLIDDRPLFTFDWAELSTGEKAYLNLFSRLYFSSKQKNSIQKENVVFLIDEPSTGFHPNWQKEYLKNLMVLIDIIWKKKKQLIITTHSPFVLSDFQTQEVVRLSKENDIADMKNTFGANIHELLADDFYLKGGFIGDLAKEKIEYVISKLNSSENDTHPDNFKKLIEIIGEPYLKQKLLMMFYKKFPETYNKEKKIKELELEIKRLRND